ncbi:MAG TPA: hypothetical protein VF796_03580 [Humisphaera sp.]
MSLPGGDVLSASATRVAVPAEPTEADQPLDYESLRRELEQHRAVQRELMRLLGTTRPDRVLHDVRNLLQERIFLEAAAKRAES